ncbi:MAG TPA: hypothetical protein VFQ40_07725 [Actinomycetota bacterium]|nr:hypothetical protein [Actinomycetota bacterium]
MRRAIAAVALAACLALAGCGSSTPRPVSRDLQARVGDVRAAVEDGRAFLARQRLLRLAAEVTRLMDGGVLDEGTGLEILDAIGEVRAALSLAPEPSPTVTQTTAPPPPPEGEGKGKGKGKGKGHGDDGHGNDD